MLRGSARGSLGLERRSRVWIPKAEKVGGCRETIGVFSKDPSLNLVGGSPKIPEGLLFRRDSGKLPKLSIRFEMSRIGILVIGIAGLIGVIAWAAPVGADRPFVECVQARLQRGDIAQEAISLLRPEQIHFRELGPRDGVPVILIHGLTGSLGTWDRVAEFLSHNYRVIAYDQRGHGQTPAVGENYSNATMANDLRGLLDLLGIQRAHIIGHSMGGRTAMQFARLFPDRVRSVVIEDMHMMGRRSALPDNLELSRKLAQLPESYPSPAKAHASLAEILGFEASEDLISHRLKRQPDGRYRLNYKPQVGVLYEVQGLQEDLTPALSAVQAPLMFLRADKLLTEDGSEILPVLWGKGVDHIRANRPEAIIRLVPGSNHGIHDSQFDDYMMRVREFFDGRSVGGNE